MRNQNFQPPTRPVTSRHTSCPATWPATGLNDEHRPPPATRLSTDPSPIVQRDGAVIIRGDALPLLYRAVHALTIRHRRDGVSSPPLLHTLRAELFRAVTSRPRHRLAETTPTKSCCTCQDGDDGDDLIGTAEAATLLSVSPRQVARLASRDVGLGGIRLRHAWVLRRAPVLALVARRKAAK